MKGCGVQAVLQNLIVIEAWCGRDMQGMSDEDSHIRCQQLKSTNIELDGLEVT